MALPQGIYFRATDNQVNPTDYDAQAGFPSPSLYPWTTAQGNSVGWETTGPGSDIRDRDATTDVRLKGLHFRSNASSTLTYRIDLPSSGGKNIRAAIGDSAAGWPCRVRFYDDASLLRDIDGLTGGAARWIDATDVVRTSESDWVNNNAADPQSFTSTIFRATIGDAVATGGNGDLTTLAALYIEDGAAAAADHRNLLLLGAG